MRLLLRCNGLNNSFAVYFHSFCPSFFCFPFILFLFPFFFLLAWNTLREPGTFTNLEHFSFNSVRWGGSWYFKPSSRGGLANFTPIAGMGHLISEPKFKIPTPLPPLLISDKSLTCLREFLDIVSFFPVKSVRGECYDLISKLMQDFCDFCHFDSQFSNFLLIQFKVFSYIVSVIF